MHANRLRFLPTLVVAWILIATNAGAAAPTDETPWMETVLQTFDNARGANPLAELIESAGGALYGTTYAGGVSGAGTVFKLTPTRGFAVTGWTESVLYSFGGGTPGSGPMAGLIADANGSLYGTTSGFGTAGRGTVFRLSPPAPGHMTWTETPLYAFTGGADGSESFAGLIADAGGFLYGTTQAGGDLTRCGGFGCGTVFRLAPPAPGQTAWTESVLYAFVGGADGQSPTARLVADASGRLYGTTSFGGGSTACVPVGCGTLFKLTPPAPGHTTWTERLLYAFTGHADGSVPSAGLVADASGALYGTTQSGGGSTVCLSHFGGCGTIFKLKPPGLGQTGWTERVLHAFTGRGDGAYPQARLMAEGGSLFGTTQAGGVGADTAGFGTVFRLEPTTRDKTRWTERVLYAFRGRADGGYPLAGLISDASGALYGTTYGGGSSYGVVFKLTRTE